MVGWVEHQCLHLELPIEDASVTRRPYTVVGVAPKGFSGLAFGAVDAWLPLRVATPEFQGTNPQLWTTDGSAWLRMIVGRRTVTGTAAQAKDDLCRQAERYALLAERASATLEKQPPVAFSWIRDRKV